VQSGSLAVEQKNQIITASTEMYETTPFHAPSLRQRRGAEYAANVLHLIGYTRCIKKSLY